MRFTVRVFCKLRNLQYSCHQFGRGIANNSVKNQDQAPPPKTGQTRWSAVFSPAEASVLKLVTIEDWTEESMAV